MDATPERGTMLLLHVRADGNTYYEEVDLKCIFTFIRAITHQLDSVVKDEAQSSISGVEYRDLRKLEYRLYPSEGIF